MQIRQRKAEIEAQALLWCVRRQLPMYLHPNHCQRKYLTNIHTYVNPEGVCVVGHVSFVDTH